MKEIEKYVLGHKKTEDVSVPSNIPFSFCEEGTCLYRYVSVCKRESPLLQWWDESPYKHFVKKGG